MEVKDRKESLRRLIIEKAIRKSDVGFILASGRRSNLYIDLRKITQDPQGINLIGRLLLNKIQEIAPESDCVGGLETASIPISTAICMLSFSAKKPLVAFWVRKQEKDHGLRNRIEGNLQRGAKVAIIEDTVTTGGSSLQAIEAVRESEAIVIQALAVVDRGGAESFRKVGVPFIALFTENDLVA